MMTLMIMTLMNLLGSGRAELLEQVRLLPSHVLVPVDGVQDELHLSLSRHLAAIVLFCSLEHVMKEKALVGTFSVITNLCVDLRLKLTVMC